MPSLRCERRSGSLHKFCFFIVGTLLTIDLLICLSLFRRKWRPDLTTDELVEVIKILVVRLYTADVLFMAMFFFNTVCSHLTYCFEVIEEKLTEILRRYQTDGYDPQIESDLKKNFYNYVELSAVVIQMDKTFSSLMFVNNIIIILEVCVSTYYFMTQINRGSNITGNDVLPLAFTLVFYTSHFFSAIHLFEQSRAVKRLLLSTLVVEPSLNDVKSQYLQLAKDRDWGLTIAKIFTVDRGSMLTISGAVFTFLVVWTQFGLSAKEDPCATGFLSANETGFCGLDRILA